MSLALLGWPGEYRAIKLVVHTNTVNRNHIKQVKSRGDIIPDMAFQPTDLFGDVKEVQTVSLDST